MIHAGGRTTYSIWEHSARVRELYARRCRLQAEEMTCHAQAAELLAPLAAPGDTLLDVGCGAGYFYHSLKKRDLALEYFGVDASPGLLAIGRDILPAHGLPPERLMELAIEDLDGAVDHVVCLNVLTNIDNYHRPLERFLRLARKSVLLRESLSDDPARIGYAYVRDAYLDPGVDLKVHVNTYPLSEVLAVIREHGFSARMETDRRTGGNVEYVIDHPHFWTFVVAERARRDEKESPCPA